MWIFFSWTHIFSYSFHNEKENFEFRKDLDKAVEMYLIKILLDQLHFIGLLQNKEPVLNASANNTSSWVILLCLFFL